MLRFLLVVTACVCAGTASRMPSNNIRIIGGSLADPGEYPTQLSLQVFGFHSCGASVLNENWALTAAHCVDRQPIGAMEILAGSNDLTSGGTRHGVTRFIMHESYNPSDSWINDIAVIEVNHPFVLGPLIQTAILPTQDSSVETGAPATVIGWGLTSEGGSQSMDLLEVDLEIRDQDGCKLAYQDVGETVHVTNICANSPTSVIGPCNSDSGGPLFVNGIVVGLVSWSEGCARIEYPTVFTRVASYRSWITDQTGA